MQDETVEHARSVVWGRRFESELQHEVTRDRRPKYPGGWFSTVIDLVESENLGEKIDSPGQDLDVLNIRWR